MLLENLLRTEDGANVTDEQIEALGSWDAAAEPDTEIQFTPARVVMQDFTGVPCIVDLATMREAVAALGGDPTKINPLSPAELVIDHSVIADLFGTENALERNVEIEYERNGERYQFLRWGQTAFDDFKVVPPGTGIVHQVNIEHLAKVIYDRDRRRRRCAPTPTRCVGTDSHTTMVNGLGVLGWGVGGIEAEAAMLGQPVSMLIPKVVGFKLSGAIPTGVTATDVVLTITEMLRKHGVVGKFVEFYGEGVASVPLANRATIGNMSPEFGSTAAMFPIDDVTLDYLRLTGRSERAGRPRRGLRQGADALARRRRASRSFSEYLELDLATVVPVDRRPEASAGPHRALATRRRSSRSTSTNYADDRPRPRRPRGLRVVPGIRPAGKLRPRTSTAHTQHHHRSHAPARRPSRRRSTLADGEKFTLDHGAVTIAAITSCTNTSNPSVMLAAGLLARNAMQEGPQGQAVGQDHARARLEGRHRLLREGRSHRATSKTSASTPSATAAPPASATPARCIDEISAAVNENDLAVTAVLSGNRNFEGRINPDVKMNYLASPPLVIAYALAGSMNFDFETDALGTDNDGNDVFLRDIWPDAAEVQATIDSSIDTGHVHTPVRRASSTATSAGARCRRRPARSSSGTTSRPTCASPRTSTA